MSCTPIALKDRAAPTPIAPPPNTRHFKSDKGASWARNARRTACQPQAKGSVSAANFKKSKVGTSNKFFEGILTNSANAPGLGGIEIICLLLQILDLPDRHDEQLSQPFNGLIVTQTPSRLPPTMVPDAS